MDYFFAAIEERENPDLRGKPIIVGADPKKGVGRGVVSTANYVGRKYGVKSGMPISKAWKICPHGIYLPVNGNLYWSVSENIMQILRKYADKFEQTSVDEAYLDVSNKVRDFEEAQALALAIKNEILESEGLACSIGIGPNKLIAKIASNYRKPDKLIVVEEKDVKVFLDVLPIRDLFGVGPKTEKIFLDMGIKTIGDLSRCPINKLFERFGSWGLEFHKFSNGIDEREVVENWNVKSIGRETTFDEDTNDLNYIIREIYELCKEVNDEIVGNNYFFKTVILKIRFENFETYTRSVSFKFYTNRVEDIIQVAKKMIFQFIRADKKFRLIGIRVTKLKQLREKSTLLNLTKIEG